VNDGFNTLSGGEGGSNMSTQNFIGKETRIRRLTPLECERLMGWPDNWTIGSDTQRYKQCGNGIIAPMVTAIINKMDKCLSGVSDER